MNEQQILASVKRQGWTVTGRRPETKMVRGVDAAGASTQEEQSTGNEVWSISGPDGGQVDSITVKVEPHTGDFSASPNGDQVRATGYSVLQGPTKEVPAAASSTTSPSAVNEAGLNAERDGNASSKWGRVTNADRIALEAAEAKAGRDITAAERSAALAEARESRAAAADARSAANQHEDNARANTNAANSNDIARQRLELDRQKANQVNTHVLGNDLVDDNGKVVFAGPSDAKYQTAQDGSILLLDPTGAKPAEVVWKPKKGPELLPGQGIGQGTFVQRDPETGALSPVANPLGSATTQQWQALHDGIAQIEGMWTRGEITPTQAAQYKDALQRNFDAQLQGITPAQMETARQARDQARMQSGQSLLNQRVSSGTSMADSLLGKAVDIVGNKNFMDPSAVAGFSVFGGASSVPDFINTLGGGQGVLDAASGAVRTGLGAEQPQSDIASTLLNHALSGGGGQQGGGAAQASGSGLLPAGDTGTQRDPLVNNPYPGQPGLQVGPDGRPNEGTTRGFARMPMPEPMALPGAGGNDMASILIQAALKGGLGRSF